MNEEQAKAIQASKDALYVIPRNAPRKDIKTAPRFHRLVVSAWLHRVIPHLYGTNRNVPMDHNPAFSPGKANKIYKRWPSIIDTYA